MLGMGVRAKPSLETTGADDAPGHRPFRLGSFFGGDYRAYSGLGNIKFVTFYMELRHEEFIDSLVAVDCWSGCVPGPVAPAISRGCD